MAPLLGGVGAAIGGSVTSFVAWRVLRDNKQARVRAEEMQATQAVAEGFAQAHKAVMASPSQSADPGDGPIEHVTGIDVGVLTFRNSELRDRLALSAEIIRWGAASEEVRDLVYASPKGMIVAACEDAMACLGANLRGETLPPPGEAWTETAGAVKEVTYRYEDQDREHRHLRRR
ncbi:hypothetical protein [Streptomyces sp. NPDC086989]|uniref:hypothetical protein n=1 Tax=Streptomyces sp. NPDC086989 TaxID=3365764 RepID=UPI00382C0451